MNNLFSRRSFVKRVFIFSPMILIAGTGIAGCGNDQKGTPDVLSRTAPCKDLSAVSKADLEKRKKLGYVNESPITERTCNKCNLWLPPSTDKQCGGCMLFKGPVEVSGYCTYWAAQQQT